MSDFTLAIIGRPNVGKSTLFNRLAGRRLALVDDRPGVTRDWRRARARLADLDFLVLDTAGLEPPAPDSLQAEMQRQTEAALARADAALLLVDARAGVTPLDHHFAEWLRRADIPVILAANKAEGRAGEAGLLEAWELGFETTLAISAEHALGMGDLAEALRPHLVRWQARHAADGLRAPADMAEADPSSVPEPGPELAPESEMPDAPETLEAEAESGPIRLAVAGRPNVGKSTLINALIGEERVLTGPEPGVTRDAITVDWVHEGRRFELVDTAGLRRKSRVTDKVEKLAVADARRAIERAQIVVLVLDANAPLEKQDLTIASLVIEEGRALVVAVNKWDAAEDRKATLAHVRERLERSLAQIRGVRFVTISAKKRKGLGRLLETVREVRDLWDVRVPTGQFPGRAAELVQVGRSSGIQELTPQPSSPARGPAKREL